MSQSYQDQQPPTSSSSLEPARKKPQVESIAAIASSSSSASAASAVSTSNASAQTVAMEPERMINPTTQSTSHNKSFLLYTDVIHCILRYATFDDLIVITQLNHLFRDSIRSLQPVKRHTIRLPAPKRKLITPYRTSALLPHVSGVLLDSWIELHPRTQMMRLAPFTNLTSVFGMVLPQFPVVFELKFPPTLTYLFIHIDERSLQSFINSANRLLNLKELRLEIRSSNRVELSPIFIPLLQMNSLEILNFHYFDATGCRLQDDVDIRVIDFLQTVREMPSLRYLDFGEASKRALSILTYTSNKLQNLQFIHTMSGYGYDESYLQLLSRLPRLTRVHDFLIDRLDISALSLLSNLTELALYFFQKYSIPPTSNIISSISHLKLIKLKLKHPKMKARQLSKILSLFPLLKHLEVIAFRSLYSLSPFKVGNVTESLTILVISSCDNLKSTQWVKLRSLTKLQTLDIQCSLRKRFSESAKQLFTPGSPHLIIPTLKHFQYYSDALISGFDENESDDDDMDEDDSEEDEHDCSAKRALN